MKKILIFYTLFFLAATHVTFAQTNLDSLKQELANVTSDSLRIKLLVELCDEYQYVNIDQAQTYASEALALAEKHNWNWALAESNVRICRFACPPNR